MTVTETFPSYFIGKDPSRRVIVVSYSQLLAQRFGRSNKRKLEEFGPELFGIEISKHNASSVNWGIEGHRGGMISGGLGGGVTGEGADLLIIDDPIKNRKEADSITYREVIWNEYQHTLLTRLQPGGAVVMILTRWHEDDLAGRVLEDEPDEWRVIKLPCEAEDDDLLGRNPGEFLWPEYGFDEEWGINRKREVGSRAWNALYQQRPAPSGGAILKRHWWKFWCHHGQASQLRAITMPVTQSSDGRQELIEIYPIELPENFDMIAQSWDMAFKSSEESSFVVGQVWGRSGADSFLLDQFRNQTGFPGTVQAVLNMSAKWPEARTKWIEDAANGPAVIQMLKKRVSGLIPVRPMGSKEARGHAVSPEVEAGNVYLPHPAIAPWVMGLIEECATAPFGSHDDQYDALTQALMKLSGRSTLQTFPKEWIGL